MAKKKRISVRGEPFDPGENWDTPTRHLLDALVSDASFEKQHPLILQAIAAGADVNATNGWHFSLLYTAIKNSRSQDFPAAVALIESGARITPELVDSCSRFLDNGAASRFLKQHQETEKRYQKVKAEQALLEKTVSSTDSVHLPKKSRM